MVGPYSQTDTDGTTGQTAKAATWTVSPVVTNDFSLSVYPNSQTVLQSSSVSYNIVTTTTSGTAQTVSFGASNLPSGLNATFSPTSVSTGSQSTLTITASASAPVGTYPLVIAASSSYTTHTYQISVTVAQAQQSTPVASVNPGNVQFSDQTVGSFSSPKTVVLTNTGAAQLALSGIGPTSGNSDYALSWPPFTPPLILPPGGSLSLQVWFEPRATGLRTGQIIFYDNATGNPQVVSLTGNGLPTPPSTGTIIVNAMLNGVTLPAAYSYQYSMTGPTSITGYDNNSFSVTPGSYSIAFQNNPSTFTLSSVTPSASQIVVAGGTTTFTLNFTAPDDFQTPFFEGASGSTQVIPAGQTATYYAAAPPLPGNASPITFSVTGVPSGAVATFNPQPGYGTSTLTVSTDTSSTPPGVYSLTLSGTNASGLTHVGAASWLAVTTPPANPVQLVSQSSTGVQGNSASASSNNSVSADGRFVVFSSTSSNLVASDTSAHSKVLIRDLQNGTTSLVSLSTSGVPADRNSGSGSISANGQYVVFGSQADNLYSGSALPSAPCGFYLRDLAHGITEREDVAPDGTAGNADSCTSVAISANGRFVAFGEDATNVISGLSGMQIYLRDRKTGQTTLISSAPDGSAGNGYSQQAAISADGRYVAFVSTSTNLVSQNTNGLSEAFVRDTENNLTSLVSISSDGQAANASVNSVGYQPRGISADGRYVVFDSSATNLAPHPTDYSTHVFLYDCQLQQTTLVDVDSVGTPLGGGGFYNPAISADGRFVVFFGFAQEFLRDAVESQTAVVSVAPDGQPDNNTSGDANSFLGLGGSRVAFASFGTNLVANDTNGQADAFVASNPFVGNVSLNSVSLGSAFVPGGSGVTGTVTLTGVAPTGGAVVSVWSNNTAGQAPGTVTVPAGATSAQFSVNTSMVDAETAMTIMASYNGGSSVAVLTLESAPELAVSPSTWDFGYQAVGTTSAIESFALTNSGTAPLAINSVQLATGQVFKISSNTCGSSIAAGGGCSVSVTFDPSASGSASDAVQISYGSPATIQSISLTGNGATPLAALSPTPLSFGNQAMPGSATAVATLSNSGNASLTNISASISGTNAADFAISSDGCSGVILPANSNCLVTIVFTPKAKGSRQAILSIADSASGSPQTISLTGTGVQSTPTLLWSPSTAAITYGTPLGTGVLDATANQSGSNLAGTFAYTATMSSGTPQTVTQATVIGAGTYTLTTTFTPTDATDYTTATATTILTVNKATSSVTTWPTASSITYGQTLASSTLSGGQSTPAGSFTFTSPTTAPGTGTASQGVTFTPTDTTDYSALTGTASVTVNKATSSVTTWPTASSITYGQTLASSTLSGGASTPAGSFAFTTPTTKPNAGTASQSVTFTPTDATNYSTLTGTASVTANKATSSVTTWPTASAITYGQTLASSTLSGGASTPAGSFVFTTPTTAPGAGTASQSVTFTPTDTTDYSTLTGTASVTVNKATSSVTTWPTASSITYGQTLASSTLSGGASTPAGSFAFTTPTTAPGAGTASQSVTFTPTDTTDYSTLTGTASVTVNKATSSVTTWPTASAITYGQTLASSTLSGGASTPAGAFAFTTPTTAPGAGTASQSVTFTPADTTDYNTVVGSANVTVTKATPSAITWPTASSITYGQTLASSTLSGGASTPAGSFAFTTTTTAPGVGTASQSVTFTPTDTTDYNTVVGSANVTVTKATPSAITWPTASNLTYGQTLVSSTLSGGASTPAGAFAFTTPTTAPGAGTASQSVTFTPTDATDYSTLTGTVSVTVNKSTPSSITWPTAGNLTYGQTLASSTLSGGASTPAGSFAFTTPTTAPGTGTASQSVTFTPTDATDYSTLTGTASVTVNKATPSVTTWPTASSITYGQTLASSTLIGGVASSGGTFAWTTPSTAPTAGAQTLSVTFTPSDTTDYSTATTTVQLTVNKATPSITWATPAAITYPTPLSATQLDAVAAFVGATVPGTFAYTPAAGTVLKAGSGQTFSVTFTPTDTTDYATPAAATTTITVNQATPTITWAAPTAITYGTALSGTQLDATASVSGTFVYNPGAGTTLPVGSDTLSVTFTPTDTTDYTTATATVQLMVNVAPNPTPVISSLSPTYTDAGAGTFTLTVTGSGFISGSTVYWGTTALTTTYVSATQLTAQIPAADIATAGTAAVITVQTAAPGGGTSNSFQFEVNSASGSTTEPTFTSTTATIIAGSPASYPVTLPSSVESASVTCLNLPTGASCSYSATTNTLTITTSSTTTKGTYQITVVFTETVAGAATSWILLPILLLPLVYLRRKLAARGVWVTTCLGLVLLAAVAYTSGCGGSSGGSSSPPPPQTHQVVSSGSVSITIQ